MPDVVVYGSVNWDEICLLPRYPEAHEKVDALEMQSALGGSGANTATWLAADLPDVQLIAAVGSDINGALCIEWLGRAGVGIGYVEVINAAHTSRASCWVVGNDKRIATYREPRLRREHAPSGALAAAAAARHLHLGSLVDGAALECLRAARDGGASISIELSGRAHDEARESADFVFLNTQELQSVFGIGNAELSTSHLELIAPKPGATLVVTHGSEAVFCVTSDGVLAFDVEPITDIVDRTGGGDAFDAGFLAGWLRHGELAAAVSGGLERARQVLGQVGGSRRGTRL